jgi:hypothetical protein
VTPSAGTLLCAGKSIPVTVSVASQASGGLVALDVTGTLADGAECTGSATATVIRVELDPVTSGTDPVPINPAIVAPMTPLALDNGSPFWAANTFALTTLEPDIDLTQQPVTWNFDVNSGFLNPQAQLVVAPDRRSARLEIPFPSFGNLGSGRMEFRLNDQPCATIDTLIKNVQPDLEPGDFRFLVKAHLCTDGQGTSTTRTPAEVQTIMSDVTKVLSQCGIIVTTSQIVTTQVDPDYMNIESPSLTEMWFLFGTDEDETAIDVFFVNTIDFDSNNNCGLTTGLTGTPNMSGGFEAGIAIPDSACDANQSSQEIVRTLAHEITHYLMNHEDGEEDHVDTEPANLMSKGADETKRDLITDQCIEMRTNYGVD